MREPARTPSGWGLRSYRGMVRFLEAVGHPAGAHVARRPGLVMSVCPAAADRSLFNSVVYEDPALLEPGLDEIADLYAEAGVRAWTVWVPEADRAGAALLAARGHSLDGSPREMGVELDEVDDPPSNLACEHPAEWAQVCAINDGAYGYEKGTFQRGGGASPDPGYRCYIGLHEGWPASALATLDAGDDCMVTMVATLPQARGRGLAGGLMLRALADARERGCRTSSLQASPKGAPLYGRLGYHDLGGLEMWERRAAGGA